METETRLDVDLDGLPMEEEIYAVLQRVDIPTPGPFGPWHCPGAAEPCSSPPIPAKNWLM